jgi:hypothetical protein
MCETKNKATRFDTIEIRYYPVVLSDNPAGKYGPPIELGWEWEFTTQQHDLASCNENKLKLDEYERERQRKRNSLYLSQVEREAILREANYTEKELMEAMRRKKRARISRAANNLLLRINPFNCLHQTVGHEIQIKKLRKARENLCKLNADGGFHDHSAIYNGWWRPI